MTVVNALADAGFLYATFDVDDDNHYRSLKALQLSGQRVYLPVIVLPEVAFLVRRNMGAHKVSTLIRALRAAPMEWLNPELVDYDRAADIMEQYKDAKLDLVDCVLMAIAERRNIQRILTLDRRDFSLVKPKHCSAFEILP